jgi:RNA polymerase-binding transcription factor DksA
MHYSVENRTYGLCKVTGKLINKERLKVPHATMSIEAKNLQR